MPYRLRDGLSFCHVGGRVIFLDLTLNRYFALDERDEASFRAVLHQEAGAGAQGLHRLVDAGLLEQTRNINPIQPFARKSAAEQSLLDDSGLASSIATRAGVCARLLETALLLRRRPIGRIIADVRAAKYRIVHHVAADVSAPVHALEATRRFLTSHDRCLLRSLALVRHLLARGIESELVFGITTRPFQAHCWVEHDNRILTDRFDIVRNYTPILVV